MPRATLLLFVDKSIGACLAAIEIYNKPNFSYREEVFSILMLNAWELLLKARVMKEGMARLDRLRFGNSGPAQTERKLSVNTQKGTGPTIR
jgi:hypothetical protein